MPERAVPNSGTSAVRLEVLKELQQLVENREVRDRIDRGPLAEAKGREHWVLHLLLRAHEVETAHTDTLIGSVYANLVSRLEAVEDRLGRVEELEGALDETVKTRLESVDKVVGDRIEAGLSDGVERLRGDLSKSLGENLDKKWAPVGESIETFAQGSKQLVRGVDDTFRLAAQTRLLLNENVRRLSDLGRDIVALEESLKLVVAKTIEQTLLPLDQRLSAVEAHLDLPGAAERNGKAKPVPSEPERV
ncbi:MAG: hypothetical protein L3K13_00230 [Thermoplasmata archaeon]|nr:hypothetical protein [Thermoplasmata archaeon]